MCAFGVLGLSCEAPAVPKPPGFHTTAREPKRAHFARPSKQPKFNEKTQRDTKRAKWWREREEKSEILGGPAEGGPVEGGPAEGGPGNSKPTTTTTTTTTTTPNPEQVGPRRAGTTTQQNNTTTTQEQQQHQKISPKH